MESWPAVAEEFSVSHDDVRENLGRVRNMMVAHDVDSLVVTSADPFLNEYTPLVDNHRYHLSGFTGSTALMVVPCEGRARIYVDGRYHIQADKEVDHELIEVVKVPLSTMIHSAVIDSIGCGGRIGCDGDRLPKSLEDAIRGAAQDVVAFDDMEMEGTLGLNRPVHSKALTFVGDGIAGRTIPERLSAVFSEIDDPESTVLLLNALDDIAWLTDGRGYHFAYQSSFAARGFVTMDAVHVFLAQSVYDAGLEELDGVEWHTGDPEDLLASGRFDAFNRLQYDPGQVTAAYARRVGKKRPGWEHVSRPSPVVAVRAIKTPAEIEHLEACNERSSRAIAKTHRWVRERMASGEFVTELGFHDAANGFYEEEGARDLSFHTISAIGASSAIIHFSDPSADVVAKPTDLMLLDSGGLYEGGIATDITRTFLAGGSRAKAEPWQKEIYTLVLKGVLRCMSAEFPEGTRGSYLDSLAREPIYAGGYDYSHGTGHGVGIHVHEPGVSLSPSSPYPIRAGHVSSIEPGIYLEGLGGVRIENVVVYEPHGEREGFIRSRPLNWIGLDENLVDMNLLDGGERAALDSYQEECGRRGTRDLES